MCAYRSSSLSLCCHSVPWLGEGLSMLLPHLPILRQHLPDGTLPVVIQFVSPTSRRSSSRSFPFVGFPGDDTQCPSFISYPADVPCPRPLPRLLNSSITSVNFIFSLTQMFVFLSRYVMFNILLSMFVSVAASLFFAWVVSAHVSALYVIAGSTHEL